MNAKPPVRSSRVRAVAPAVGAAAFVALAACATPYATSERDLGVSTRDGGAPSGSRGDGGSGGAGDGTSTADTSNGSGGCFRFGGSTCGTSPQCGCEPDFTCDVQDATTGDASCVAAGGGASGDPCVDTSGCAVGLTCVYGACRAYCKTPGDACAGDDAAAGSGTCVGVTASGAEVPHMFVCTIRCDPRAPASSCGANACYSFATLYSPIRVTDCGTAGGGAAGAACAADDDCAAGLACGPAATCRAWCRLATGASDCAGAACEDTFGDVAPVIDGVREGLCP